MSVPLLQTVLFVCFALVWVFVGAMVVQAGKIKGEEHGP